MNYDRLKGLTVAKGSSITSMCDGIGVNKTTLWRQCKSGKLPILTVKKIIDALSLTREEVNYVFFEE